MKNLKLIGFLMILASSLMFIQCTSDPIAGTAGIDGTNGTNGTDGAQGVAGNTACLECHSTGTIDEKTAEYNTSGHALGTAFARGSSNRCAQCHSNEGYIKLMTGQDVIGEAFPTTIGCKTCHALHDPESIAQGDTEFNLRNTAGTLLMISTAVGSDITIDLEGNSNACVSCHQPRRAHETYLNGLADTDLFSVPAHWGPHYGVQSTFFEGLQLVEIAGTATYPTVQSPHRAGASCVSCHMSETESGTGGHSWKANLGEKGNCYDCHVDGVTALVEFDDETGEILGFFGYDAAITELRELLVARNVLIPEYSTVEDEFGNYPIIDHHANENDDITVIEAKALWNWITLNDDSSKGIHNPPYAKAALTNSIEALQ